VFRSLDQLSKESSCFIHTVRLSAMK
jgi:hypothetical protein